MYSALKVPPPVPSLQVSNVPQHKQEVNQIVTHLLTLEVPKDDCQVTRSYINKQPEACTISCLPRQCLHTSTGRSWDMNPHLYTYLTILVRINSDMIEHMHFENGMNMYIYATNGADTKTQLCTYMQRSLFAQWTVL